MTDFYFQCICLFLFITGSTITGNGQVTGYVMESNGQRVTFITVSGLAESTMTPVSQTTTMTRANTIIPVVKNLDLLKIKCSSESDIYKWFCTVTQTTRQKRDVVVKGIGQNGAILKSWRIIQASPIKMGTPTLNASGNEVAIDTLVLTYERIELVR